MNKKVQDVFTPRSQNVNNHSYVKREEIIKELERAFNGSKNIIIHGESGTGKSWLYKKYFSDKKITYLTANLANASRLGSLNKELENVFERQEEYIQTGKKTSNEIASTIEVEGNWLTKWFAKIKANIITKRNKTNEFRTATKEPFERCLQVLYKNAVSNKTSVLVLDNFESVLNNASIQKELSDLILLLDDERYGQYNVKLLIVGTPNDIMYYFSKINDTASVSNRLHELPQISRMTVDEAKNLVEKGFIQELKFHVDDYEQIIQHILWITDQIPQRLQEYCEILGHQGESDRKLNASLLEHADILWLRDSLSHSYTRIEQMMNSRTTKVGRKNQIMYCLGKIGGNEITLTEIEDLIRSEFPESTKNVTINPSQNLSILSSEQDSIIKKSPKGNSYFFSDPKYKLCLRVMLKKDDEKVDKIDITKI